MTTTPHPRKPKPKPKPRPAAGSKTVVTKSDNETPKNLNQVRAQQRQLAARRRAQVGDLYHAGQTQMEIADMLGVTQATVSGDLAYLRKKWTEQATAVVGEWVERELAYAISQRNEARVQWITAGHNSRMQQVMLRWTERIARLLGLDAPTKIAPTTPDGEREWSGKSDSELVSEFAALVETARARASTQSGE